MANTPELSTRRELDFVDRIQMISPMTWSSNGSTFAPCHVSKWLQVVDRNYQHSPLAFRNPCIHPRPFLRDRREVDLA